MDLYGYEQALPTFSQRTQCASVASLLLTKIYYCDVTSELVYTSHSHIIEKFYFIIFLIDF